MKQVSIILAGLMSAALFLAITSPGYASETDLAPLRAATARFHRVEAAKAAGYDLIPGLDHCFESPGVGAMGYHYIAASSLDLNVEALHPEAMVYAPGPGGLELAAVEYIVPANDWDQSGHTDPPSVLGHSLHLNEALGVYVLHAWIWKNNPAGMFEDFNPNVSCQGD